MSNNSALFVNMFPKTNALDVSGIVEATRLNFPFYHDVDVIGDQELKEMVVWSIENLGGVSDKLTRWWLCDFSVGIGANGWKFRFYFKFEDDQLAFKLRWI